MKPFSSFFVILILFQSLFLGNLVKLELPDVLVDTWDITLIHKQVVLDPFLLPGKEVIDQSIRNKNEWVPFQFDPTFILRNRCTLPVVSEILYKPEINSSFKPIPVFILNHTLRI